MKIWTLQFKDSGELVPPLDVDQGAFLAFRSRREAEDAAARQSRIYNMPIVAIEVK